MDELEGAPEVDETGASDVVEETVAVLVRLTVCEGLVSPLGLGSAEVVGQGDTRSGHVSVRFRSLSKGPVGPS